MNGDETSALVRSGRSWSALIFRVRDERSVRSDVAEVIGRGADVRSGRAQLREESVLSVQLR
jgi:hypothetical protein